MDLPTQAHLTTLRELLLYRQHELQANRHAAEQARQRAGPSTGAAAGEEQRDADELMLVDAALRRLDEGTYGDCAQCGLPIPLQRLLVQPAVLRCAACQAVLDPAGRRQPNPVGS
jgi:DnaK suppressor protein